MLVGEDFHHHPMWAVVSSSVFCQTGKENKGEEVKMDQARPTKVEMDWVKVEKVKRSESPS